MFTLLQPSSDRKQYFAFAASTCMQFLLLAAIVALGGVRHGRFGHSGHLKKTHPTVSQIYFKPQPVETPAIASPAPVTAPKPPEIARKEELEEPKDNADSKEEMAANEQEGDGSWTMDSMPASFIVYGHEVKTAQPIFTPDPPILHQPIPDDTRGKEIVMEVVIDERGIVTEASIAQDMDYAVAHSIVETLKSWTFTPASVNGMATASRRVLRFRFPG